MRGKSELSRRCLATVICSLRGMETLEIALEVERDDDVFIQPAGAASSNGFFRRRGYLLFVDKFGGSVAGRGAMEEGATTSASEIVSDGHFRGCGARRGRNAACAFSRASSPGVGGTPATRIDYLRPATKARSSGAYVESGERSGLLGFPASAGNHRNSGDDDGCGAAALRVSGSRRKRVAGCRRIGGGQVHSGRGAGEKRIGSS